MSEENGTATVHIRIRQIGGEPVKHRISCGRLNNGERPWLEGKKVMSGLPEQVVRDLLRTGDVEIVDSATIEAEREKAEAQLEAIRAKREEAALAAAESEALASLESMQEAEV